MCWVSFQVRISSFLLCKFARIDHLSLWWVILARLEDKSIECRSPLFYAQLNKLTLCVFYFEDQFQKLLMWSLQLQSLNELFHYSNLVLLLYSKHLFVTLMKGRQGYSFHHLYHELKSKWSLWTQLTQHAQISWFFHLLSLLQDRTSLIPKTSVILCMSCRLFQCPKLYLW